VLYNSPVYGHPRYSVPLRLPIVVPSHPLASLAFTVDINVPSPPVLRNRGVNWLRHVPPRFIEALPDFSLRCNRSLRPAATKVCFQCGHHDTANVILIFKSFSLPTIFTTVIVTSHVVHGSTACAFPWTRTCETAGKRRAIMEQASTHRNIQPIGNKPASLNQRVSSEQLHRPSVLGVWTKASRTPKRGQCPPLATQPKCETVAACPMADSGHGF